MGSKTYVQETIKNLEKIFGQFKKEQVPMSPGDHPEDDKSEEPNQTDQELFQMLIGTARWIISLGWIDILFAVSELDRFNASPRDRHLTQVLKIFGYLKKYPNQEICINPAIPDLCDFKPEVLIGLSNTLMQRKRSLLTCQSHLGHRYGQGAM